MRSRQYDIGWRPSRVLNDIGYFALQCGKRICIHAASFGDNNNAFAFAVIDRKRRNAARAHAGNFFHGPFNVLRPDVAAIDNDQILGAPGNDDLFVKEVPHVACIKPFAVIHG